MGQGDERQWLVGSLLDALMIVEGEGNGGGGGGYDGWWWLQATYGGEIRRRESTRV